MGGFAGMILYVDLTSGRSEARPLQADFAREYMGGLGFGAKIYLDLIKNNQHFDALSPDNPFVLMTGPLTGFRVSGTARWCVGCKSPLTGYWGDANAGGFFGARLKFAGYDGIVITGASDKPVYLFIDDGKVEIRDAAKYWGKDTYVTNDEMVADLRSESKKSGEVLAIGPAGENLVKFASIINRKGHSAGRTGMGAVWGAKKLKAIFVRGSGDVEAARKEDFEKLRDELKEIYKEHITVDALKEMGTACHWDPGLVSGDLPIKNWSQAEWEEIDEIGPVAYGEKMKVGNKTCYGCTVACKIIAEVKEGAFKFEKGAGPEYETLCSFGTMCLNSNLFSIGKANDLCNRFGMDTITCGSTIAFAIECFENGLITKEDTDGIELGWGNAEAIIRMTRKIGKQEGFGKILAEGSARAAEKIGGNAADYLSTVKGLEAPMHDPRSSHGYGLAYAVSPRGACHGASLNFSIEGGNMYFPEIAEFAEEFEEQTSEGRAKLNVACQDFGMFFSSSAVYCHLGAMPMTATQAVELVNYVTGFGYTIDELMQLGRRIWYLKRGLSNLFGARAEHDKLPTKLTTPLEDGPTAGSAPNMELMLKEFYELRGLNSDGLPTVEILEKIGLGDLAALLYHDEA
ncbi:MAG: aldehyde ferredoxin oxidoreductase family protein [Deltaproteobacteria bacterium]|nr:aldehyde ferredoxin oxidoreductase family protein [Deltaproteobacteria bacterium]